MKKIYYHITFKMVTMKNHLEVIVPIMRGILLNTPFSMAYGLKNPNINGKVKE